MLGVPLNQANAVTGVFVKGDGDHAVLVHAPRPCKPALISIEAHGGVGSHPPLALQLNMAAYRPVELHMAVVSSI